MHKLLKKFMTFSYGSIIGLIIGVLTTMITTRLLLPADFGKASMFTLALNISLIIITFGSDQAFMRFFYEEKEEKRGALLYNCLRLPFLAILLLSLLILLFYSNITLFLFDDVSITLALVLLLGIITQFIMRFSKIVIRMQQKGNLFSVLEIIDKSINLLFILILFSLLGSDYRVIIFSTVISLFFMSFIGLKFGKNIWSLKNIVIKETKHTRKDIVKYGTPFILTIFITWLFESIDKIALRHWSGFEELGLYSAAFRIVALMTILRTTFTTFWTPVSYEKFENEPKNTEFFGKISRIVSISMFLVAIISIAGKDIIVLLLGKEFSEAATIMPFLVFMPLLHTISETTVIGINFYKKTKLHIVVAAIACIVNILGNWMLVPKYGALGASFSTAIAYVVFFTLRTQMSLKLFKVNYELRKVYTMIVIISLYSVFSIWNEGFYFNILAGLISFCILLLIYIKDIKSIIRKKV